MLPEARYRHWNVGCVSFDNKLFLIIIIHEMRRCELAIVQFLLRRWTLIVLDAPRTCCYWYQWSTINCMRKLPIEVG